MNTNKVLSYLLKKVEDIRQIPDMYYRYLIYYVVINNSMYKIEDYILDRFGDLGDVDLTYIKDTLENKFRHKCNIFKNASL